MNNNRISVPQLQVLVAVNIIGICLLMVTGECGSILSVLGACMLSLLYAAILSRKDILSVGLFRHIYSVRVAVYTAIFIRIICECIRLYSGNGLNVVVLGLFTVLTCLYGIYKGIEAVTRAVMIFSLPIIAVIVMGCLFSLDGASLAYINYGLKSSSVGEALVTSFSFIYVDVIIIGASLTDKRCSNSLIYTVTACLVFIVLVSVAAVVNVGEEVFSSDRLIIPDILSSSTSLSIINQNNGFYFMLWLFAAIFGTVSGMSLLPLISDRKYISFLFVILSLIFIILPIDIDRLFDIFCGFNVISGAFTTLIIPMLMQRRKYEE